MKIDLYTTGVLTVIAVSLFFIAFKEFTSFVRADSIQRVALSDVSNTNCAYVRGASLRVVVD